MNTLQISHYTTDNQMPDPLDAIVNSGTVGTLIIEDVTNNKGGILVDHGRVDRK